jgi:hypothetical protein
VEGIVHFLAGVAVYVVHFITVPAKADGRQQLGLYSLGSGNNNTVYVYIF